MTIVRDQEIRSGKPTVKGTRITVGDIAERFYKLGRSSSTIASDLEVSGEEVEEALRYYHNQVLDQKTGSPAEA